MNSRALLKSAPSVATLLATEPLRSIAGSAQPSPRAQASKVIASSFQAIANTNAGAVSGYIRTSIFTFKDIPYGDSTEGPNRFQSPSKTSPWSGVRSHRQYGPVAPQSNRTGPSPKNDEEAFVFGWDDAIYRVYRPGQSEDCLRLNLWTPMLESGKLPVMVWIHGGKFAYGSGQEQPAYDGENLARSGGVVVISLNHRLNVFGFLNLSKYGERYACSANAGMLDLVLALEWVRDNVTAFGGDPSRVTILGQSGGGSKVCMLMSMPAAKGLFHRAIVQSGSMPMAGSEESSSELTKVLLNELQLNEQNIDRINDLSFETIQQASDRALQKFLLPGNRTDFNHLVETWGFVPVLDGCVIPSHPFDTASVALSSGVPLLTGSNLNEFYHSMDHPELESMTTEELEAKVLLAYGTRSNAILLAFRMRTPHAKPFDLWSRIAASAMRSRAIEHCRTRMHAAPAYLYWLCGRPPSWMVVPAPFTVPKFLSSFRTPIAATP